jgi:hypothetical protein
MTKTRTTRVIVQRRLAFCESPVSRSALQKTAKLETGTGDDCDVKTKEILIRSY